MVELVDLDKAFSMLYYTYNWLGILGNALLVWWILAELPKELRPFLSLITDKTASQLFANICVLFLQIRVIPAGSGAAIVSLGPCQALPPQVCKILNALMMGFIENALITTSMAMILRYTTLKHTPLGGGAMLGICFILAIIPVSIAVCTMMTLQDYHEIAPLVEKYDPEYNLSIYGQFIGYPNTLDPLFLWIVACAIIPNVVSLMAVFYFRNRVLIIVAEATSFSAKTKYLLQRFLLCLTFQMTIPPCLCAIPTALYCFVQYTGTKIKIAEFVSFPFVFRILAKGVCAWWCHLLYLVYWTFCLPCALNSYVSFYCITPFRHWIMAFFDPAHYVNPVRSISRHLPYLKAGFGSTISPGATKEHTTTGTNLS